MQLANSFNFARLWNEGENVIHLYGIQHYFALSLKNLWSLVSILLLVVWSVGCIAQPYGDSKFKKKFTKAEALVYDDAFLKALPLLEEMYKYDTLNANLNHLLGICYLRGEKKYSKAIRFLENATRDVAPPDMYQETSWKERRAPGVTYFYLGKAYHSTNVFDRAVSNYYNYRSFISLDDVETYNQVRQQIQYAENAKELVKNPVGVKITNLGAVVNTKYPEYCPVVSADGKVLIFTSRRMGGVSDATETDGTYFEDIYMSEKSANGKWTKPKSIGSNINSAGHEAAIGLSPDGQLLFIYKDDNNDGNLYQSRRTADGWSDLEPLGSDVNTNSWETHASITATGDMLVFTSNRSEGGYGGRDLWYCQRLPNGEWSLAQNMGSVINTDFEEDSPFISADGKTLIFSSMGHTSMGGFDIFRSEFVDGAWTAPENIGYPINTAEDDVFFVLAPDGKTAYYSSRQEGGFGDADLFKLKLQPKRSNALAVARGVMKVPAMAYADISARIEVTDEGGADLGIYRPNPSTGYFVLVLPPNETYTVTYFADGYEPVVAKLPIGNDESYQEYEGVLELDEVVFGEDILALDEETKRLEQEKAEAIRKAEEEARLAVEAEEKAKEAAEAALLADQKEQERLKAEKLAAERKEDAALALAEQEKKAQQAELERKKAEAQAKYEAEQQLVKQKAKAEAEAEAELVAAKAEEEKLKAEELAAENKALELAEQEQERKKAEALAKYEAEQELERQKAIKEAEAELLAAKAEEERLLAEKKALAIAEQEKKKRKEEEQKKREAQAKQEAELKAQIAAEAELLAAKKEEDRLKAEKLAEEREAQALAEQEEQKRLAEEAKKKEQERSLVEETARKNEADSLLFIAAAEKKRVELQARIQLLKEKQRQQKTEVAVVKEVAVQETEIDNQDAKVDAEQIEAKRKKMLARIEQLKQEKNKESEFEVQEEALVDDTATEITEESGTIEELKENLDETAQQIEEIEEQERKRLEQERLAAEKFEEEQRKEAERAKRELIQLEALAQQQAQVQAAIEAEEKKKQAIEAAEQKAFSQEEILANANTLEELRKLNEQLIKDNLDLKKQLAELNAKLDQILQRLDYQPDASKVEIPTNRTLKNLQEGKRLILRNIFFDYNLATLRSRSKHELNKLYDFLKNNADIKIEISGHTDSRGNDDYNLRLSRDRAQAVMDYLVRNGISSKRLSAVGYGETRPIARNENADLTDNPVGRQLNRRIEIRIPDGPVEGVEVEKIQVPAGSRLD